MFVMPTIGEQIGPDLQGIASVIRQFKNPNYDIQAGLRQAIAQNPDILQKLIDLGPDKVGSIFGKEARNLGVGEQSIGKQIEDTVKGLFGTDSTFREELIAGKTGTKTSAERKSQELDIKGKESGNRIAGVQANIAEKTEDAQIQQVLDAQKLLKQKVTDMQSAVNAIPNIGAIDINKTVMDAFRGRGDANTMMRLQQAGIDIGPLVNSLQQQAQIAASFSLAKLREQSKEVKYLALNHIEKRIDDTRNKIAQADAVIKSLGKDIRTATMMTQKARPLDESKAGLWDGYKTTVDTYNAALQAKQEAEKEYSTYNPVYNGLLDNLVKAEGVKVKDIVPPELESDVAKLNAANPIQRKAALLQIRKANPLLYDKIVPFISNK